MSSRLPCDQCGSTEFEEENGIIVCDQGHYQEGGQQRIGEDDGQFHAAGKVSRTKKDKVKEKIVKVYRGAQGYQLYLKAWQYILWTQCHSLVHRLGLPPHLWDTVRELWTLRLSKLAVRLEDRGLEDAGTATFEKIAMAAELAQGDDKTLKGTRLAGDHPTLWDTIGLNCLAILLLRRPLSLSMIYDHIRDESICFIRAIRHVPPDIRERLAPEYHRAFETSVIPQREDIQLAVFHIAVMYSTSFGMVSPALNSNLMLLQYLRQLALPLEIYGAARHIAALVGFDFAYPAQRQIRRTATTFPEAQLMATIAIATKLMFPLDTKVTMAQPYTLGEPASLVLDWDSWAASREALESHLGSNDRMNPRRALQTTDADVLDMEPEELDRYMDWFQASYTSEVRTKTNVSKQILDMFPLLTTATEVTGEVTPNVEAVEPQLRLSQSRLTSRRSVPESEEGMEPPTTGPIRPGQRYQQHRRIADISGPAQIFYREAAELGCLDIESLLRAVRRTEGLLLRSQLEKRRAGAFLEDAEIGSDDG